MQLSDVLPETSTSPSNKRAASPMQHSNQKKASRSGQKDEDAMNFMKSSITNIKDSLFSLGKKIVTFETKFDDIVKQHEAFGLELSKRLEVVEENVAVRKQQVLEAAVVTTAREVPSNAPSKSTSHVIDYNKMISNPDLLHDKYFFDQWELLLQVPGVSKCKKFLEGYFKLLCFVQEYDHCRIPTNNPDFAVLDHWVKNTRNAMRKYELHRTEHTIFHKNPRLYDFLTVLGVETSSTEEELQKFRKDTGRDTDENEED